MAEETKLYGIASPEPDHFYVAGPMTGYEDFNYPLFKRVTAHLRKFNYQVQCPTELAPKEENHSYGESLRRDLAGLLKANRLCLLPGWEDSKGALFEALIAKMLDMRFFYCYPTKYAADDGPAFYLHEFSPTLGYIAIRFLQLLGKEAIAA